MSTRPHLDASDHAPPTVPRFDPLPEHHHRYDELVRYVPLALAQRYARAGWTVRPMRCHHGAWSALASRWVERGEAVHDGTNVGSPTY